MMKKLSGAPLTGVAALAAWVMLAPDAVADTNDDAYLNAMEAHNIHSIGGPGDLIYAGHQVCGFLSPDTSPAMVTDYVVRGSVNGGRFYTVFGSAHNPLTSSQAGILVNDAIGTYCPNSPGAAHWHAPSFPVS
jgi:Protein of unknown function (DUF732)